MEKVDSVALFDSLADRYDQVLPMFGTLGSAVVASLRVRPGERVLDVGCGRGAVAFAAADVGADVVAVDAATQMVRAVNREGPTFDVLVMDASSLAFGNDRFDTAIAAFVANVVDDQEGMAAEMARVVATGGRVVLVLPGEVDPTWERFFGLFSEFTPRAGAARTSQPADAKRLLMKAGLSDLETWSVTSALSADSPEQVWEQSMTHGFAGYVGSLSDRDRAGFQRRVLEVLGDMQARDPLRLLRTAEVTCGRVPLA